MQLEHHMKKSNILTSYLKNVSKHPFFGIFVAAFVMVILQIMQVAGLILSSILENLSIIWIYSIVGLGFTLLLGYAGLASLGTAGFIGVGTYVIYYFLGQQGMPLIVAMIIGVLIAVVLGTAVGFISLRIEGMYLAIITLGLSEILVEVFKFGQPFTAGLQFANLNRLVIFGRTMAESDIYYILVFALILTMIGVLNLINSPTGRAMLSIKNSTSAAQAMGISVLRTRLLSFVLATTLAMIGGMLYMMYVRSTEPLVWNIGLSLNILAAVVIGGSKSIWGVVLGTMFIFGLDPLVLRRISFFRTYGNASFMINGILIILVVMFYPGGLIRLFKDVYQWLKKRLNQIKTLWKEYRYGKDHEVTPK